MEFKVYTEYGISNNGHSMAIMSIDPLKGERSFVQPFALKSFPEHSYVPREETFCLVDRFGKSDVRQFLQAMMDAAWEFGLRPTGVNDQKDELAAVRYHLEDMRKLALSAIPGVT